MYPWQTFILGLCEHLAWPIIFIFCVIFFRQDIHNILSRLDTLPFGGKLNPETVEKQKDAKEKFNSVLQDLTHKIEEQSNQKEKQEDR